MTDKQFLAEKQKEYHGSHICGPYPHLMGKELLTIPYLSFGDYDNSCHIERSNVEVFMEMFKDTPGWHHFTGSYSSEWIGIGANAPEEVWEVIDSLYSYPCLDDEHASRKEWDMLDSYWEALGYSEYIDLVAEKYSIEDAWEFADPDAARQYFEETVPDSMDYPLIEAGGNVYIDFERVLEHFPDEMPKELTINQ